MAKKNIKVFVNDAETEVTVRRIKKKEFKALVTRLAGKGDELATLFDKADFFTALPGLLEENFNFISNELILPFVSLTAEQLDDMDVVDIIGLGKELLEYNSVSVEKIINFLKPDPATRQAVSRIIDFKGVPVPSQN